MSSPDSEHVVGRSRSRHPYGDIVDFVERTTYAIWNDRRIDLIPAHYGPDSVIWEESATSSGRQVTVASERKQASYPDLRGVIPDTIWTGDDASGYRTSMRWQSRGTNTGPGPLGPPTGRLVHDTCIANCVVLGDQYLEEWNATNPEYAAELKA